MPRLRIPLFGTYINRNINPGSFSADDQAFTNGYPEVIKNDLTGGAKVFFNKRPGFVAGSALTSVSAAGAVGVIVSWSGNSNSVPPVAAGFKNVGGSTSVWDLGNGTKIGGDIANTGDVVALSETIVSTTANLVGNFTDSATAAVERWFFPEGGAWTQVTDGDFPTDIVGFPAHMDGYAFDMAQDGRIWNSDLNSVSSYTATSFLNANLYPDKGITVARHGHYIVGFGEKSTEFFVNAGNAFGSPLNRIQNGGLHIGAARRSSALAHHTVLPAHNTVYFIGTNSDSAAIGVYRLKGLEPEKVSNIGIDKLVASAQLTGFLGTLVLHGMRHVVLQGDAGVWCYCIESNFWWRLTLASGEVIGCLGVGYSASANAVSYFIGNNNARSNLISSSGPVYQDDGAAYTMTVQTDNIDAGTDRMKLWKRLRIVCDRQSTGVIGVAWSDDDFDNFTSATNIDITSNQSWITRLGASRRRSFRLTHSANTPCRIEAIEIDYEVGSH